jgi:hypothetical protein
VFVFRRRPHYFPSSQSPIPCCGSNTTLSKLRTASSRSSRIPLASHSVRLKLSRCISGYLRRPSFQYAASAASAASSPSPPFPIVHHSSASAHNPLGAGIQNSFGTQRAIAKLSLSSLPSLFLQNCFFALLPHSDWAYLEQRLFCGACRQCTRLPTQLTAGDT